MTTTYNIASSLSNRLGEDRFYLALDYDAADIVGVEADVKELQAAFGLGEATIYRTKNGYHAHFFQDNALTHEETAEILAASKLVDARFRESFSAEQAGGSQVTMRAAGKHPGKDISFFKSVPGTRKPSHAEASMAKSLKALYETMVESPIVDHSRYSVEVSDGEGGEAPAAGGDEDGEAGEAGQEAWDALPAGAEKPEAAAVPSAVSQEATAEEETADAEDEMGPDAAGEKPFFREEAKRTVESVRPEWGAIGRQIGMWYRGPLGKQVGRAISAAADGRELSFIVPQDLRGIKGHEGLLSTRPFFFKNSPIQELMLEPYTYCMEHGRVEMTPLNFFMSHARFDLSRLVGKASFHNFKDLKALQQDMSERFSDYLTGFDLIFDVDSKDPDANHSWTEAKKLRDALAARYVPFSMLFSGSKGFHFRIHADDINRAAPFFLESIKKDPELAVRRAHQGLLRFAENAQAAVDEKAYNGVHRAIIRVPWSVHQATGAVAKPLTDAEFDAMAGKTLRQVQEMMLPENLLEGNKETGTRKLTFQRSDFVVRALAKEEWLTWEEMRDSKMFEAETDMLSADGKRKYKEWEKIRAEVINPAVKELRALNERDAAALSRAMAAGEFNGCRVEPGEWIDMSDGRNWDYRRAGSDKALRDFVLEITN